MTKDESVAKQIKDIFRHYRYTEDDLDSDYQAERYKHRDDT